MDELLEQFLIEGRDLVAQVQAELVRLEADPADAAAIDGAFRAVHTLKGSVGIFDMAPAERLLHTAEDHLERARRQHASLAPTTIAALIDCLDQVDRWIDRLEHSGGLGEGAEGEAAALIDLFSGERGATSPAGEAGAAPDWLESLLQRMAEAVEGQPTPQTAFRYVPDKDCFFRGDDPLAIAGAVPELLALSVLPVEGVWPAAASIEPFICLSAIEGLSAAPPEAVGTAFRMVADQIQVAAVDLAAGAIAAPAAPATGPVALAGALRVDARRIDALADGLGELIVATNAFAPIAQAADAVDRALALRIRAAQAQVDRAIAELHRTVSAVRMVSLAPSLRRLPRLVREIAGQLGKPVRFELRGEAVEVDKQIADGLFEPLLHLLRNALDHGLEDGARRAAAGKPVMGMLTLDITREGDAILVALSDDGSGIDADRIRAAAVMRGLVTSEAAEALSDAAAIRLIFEPGFSTAEAVTGVSGRGVGMDAVRSAIERLRGSIEIDTAPGRGTIFRLRLPANALTTRLLVIEVGGDRYGVALDQIVETVRIASEALVPLGSGTAVVLRDRTVPVLGLAALLGGEDRPAPAAKLLVTRSGGELVAVRVDGFGERIDTLVRPPSGILASVPGVTGTSLTGDGDVLLILDLPELVA
jgi:two-component system chemotaxis sensor kinase CheA